MALFFRWIDAVTRETAYRPPQIPAEIFGTESRSDFLNIILAINNKSSLGSKLSTIDPKVDPGCHKIFLIVIYGKWIVYTVKFSWY